MENIRGAHMGGGEFFVLATFLLERCNLLVEQVQLSLVLIGHNSVLVVPRLKLSPFLLELKDVLPNRLGLLTHTLEICFEGDDRLYDFRLL
jgi:hypothetical protein